MTSKEIEQLAMDKGICYTAAWFRLTTGQTVSELERMTDQSYLRFVHRFSYSGDAYELSFRYLTTLDQDSREWISQAHEIITQTHFTPGVLSSHKSKAIDIFSAMYGTDRPYSTRISDWEENLGPRDTKESEDLMDWARCIQDMTIRLAIAILSKNVCTEPDEAKSAQSEIDLTSKELSKELTRYKLAEIIDPLDVVTPMWVLQTDHSKYLSFSQSWFIKGLRSLIYLAKDLMDTRHSEDQAYINASLAKDDASRAIPYDHIDPAHVMIDDVLADLRALRSKDLV